MALPGGRKIVVDGKNYEWIVRERRYDEWDKILTIRVDEDGGKLVQHTANYVSITPEFVAEFIKKDVKAGKL